MKNWCSAFGMHESKMCSVSVRLCYYCDFVPTRMSLDGHQQKCYHPSLQELNTKPDNVILTSMYPRNELVPELDSQNMVQLQLEPLRSASCTSEDGEEPSTLSSFLGLPYLHFFSYLYSITCCKAIVAWRTQDTLQDLQWCYYVSVLSSSQHHQLTVHGLMICMTVHIHCSTYAELYNWSLWRETNAAKYSIY